MNEPRKEIAMLIGELQLQRIEHWHLIQQQNLTIAELQQQSKPQPETTGEAEVWDESGSLVGVLQEGRKE